MGGQFYGTYFSVMRAELGEIPGKANQMQSSIVVSVELLKENVPNDGWLL